MVCALLAALKRGELSDITQLITAEKDIDQQDEIGVTALQFATQQGYYDIVKALLIAGADPNIKNTFSDLEQNNSNDYNSSSYIYNSNDASDTSIVSKTDNYNKLESSFKPEHFTLEKMLQELQNLGSASALHIAIKYKQLEIAKLLLIHGADPNIIDSGHCTPLHWAAAKAFQAGVQLLLNYKADPNLQDLAQSTALHEAMRKGDVNIIRILLEKNANPNLPDVSGETVCNIAAEDSRLLEVLTINSKFMPQGWLCH